MGDFMLSISGFYCISIAFLRNNTEILNHLGDFLFFDPSVLIGSLLAPDLGGYSIVEMISKDPNMIVFAGVLLTSTIGATISFQLPIFLNNLEKDDVPSFMQGIAYGLIVLPIVLILVGLFLQIDSLMINMIPLLVLCIFLLFMFFINLKLSVKILTIFANMIRILGYLFFFLVCFDSVCLVGRYRRCSVSIRKLLVFSIRTDKSFCFFSCISDLVPVLLCINDLAHLPITSISICLIYGSCFSAVFVRNICKFPFII